MAFARDKQIQPRCQFVLQAVHSVLTIWPVELCQLVSEYAANDRLLACTYASPSNTLCVVDDPLLASPQRSRLCIKATPASCVYRHPKRARCFGIWKEALWCLTVDDKVFAAKLHGALQWEFRCSLADTMDVPPTLITSTSVLASTVVGDNWYVLYFPRISRHRLVNEKKYLLRYSFCSNKWENLGESLVHDSTDEEILCGVNGNVHLFVNTARTTVWHEYVVDDHRWFDHSMHLPKNFFARSEKILSAVHDGNVINIIVCDKWSRCMKVVTIGNIPSTPLNPQISVIAQYDDILHIPCVVFDRDSNTWIVINSIQYTSSSTRKEESDNNNTTTIIKLSESRRTPQCMRLSPSLMDMPTDHYDISSDFFVVHF